MKFTPIIFLAKNLIVLLVSTKEKSMSSPPEYGILPKLLPQVIKAIVDLHELNGSTIDDIIDQVKTNMAFYGIRSTKKNIKAQVHLCLRHGVRLGCFRVESQGKFRLNKLKYCVPVLKCVLSPHCVNSAVKSRYLKRHCSNNDQSQQLQQSSQRQQQEDKEQLQQEKNQQRQQQRNSKTKKSNSKNNNKRSSTCKKTATCKTSSSDCTKTRSSSSRSQGHSPPRVGEVISEMNTDMDKSLLPFFSNPLTSYKKRSNTSVISIYDPAGHMGPQMECKDGINPNDKSTNVQENMDNIAMTTNICRKTARWRTAPTIRSSLVSTKLSSVTINSSMATTRERSSEDVRKLKQSEGVLKTLQRKFDQLQKCIWGGDKSSRNPITPDDLVKNGDSSGFTKSI